MTQIGLVVRSFTTLAFLICFAVFDQHWYEAANAFEPQFGFGTSSTNNTGSIADSLWNNAWNQAMPRPTSFPQSANPNLGGGNVQPNLSPPRRGLQFGAYLENTETGAIVKQVQSGSSAERAGIQPGDVIVTVDGYQVGYHNGRLYDLGDEVEKRTSPEGRITMLVLDNRNRQLRSILVDMQSSDSSVTGQVALANRVSLPFGSILTVQIRNVDRPFYEVNGGQQVYQVEGAGPFPFQMIFDARWIEQRDRYAVTAFVSYNGQTIYNLDTPMSINPSGRVPPLSLVLTPPQVVQAGASRSVSYPPDYNMITQTYQKILGKSPSPKELEAWSQYLSSHPSLGELEASLLASPPFYDLAGNDPNRFIQKMIYVTTGRQATTADINRWSQYRGPRQALVREYLGTAVR